MLYSLVTLDLTLTAYQTLGDGKIKTKIYACNMQSAIRHGAALSYLIPYM